jgi:Ni/Co efflux regulator RcnB
MKLQAPAVLAFAMLTGIAGFAQDRNQQDRNQTNQFSDHDRQVANDWYKQHQAHPPAGLRDQDRFSNEQESRFREGAPLDKDLRGKVHSAPPDLYRQLPQAPAKSRYVAVGGHVALIDNGYNVKAVIHLHDNH